MKGEFQGVFWSRPDVRVDFRADALLGGGSSERTNDLPK